jgi:hypothetical protein
MSRSTRAGVAVGSAPQQVGLGAVEVGVGEVLPAERVERPGAHGTGRVPDDGGDAVHLGGTDVVGGVDDHVAVDRVAEGGGHGGDGVAGEGDHDHLGVADRVGVGGRPRADAGGQVPQGGASGLRLARVTWWPAAVHLPARVAPMLPVPSTAMAVMVGSFGGYSSKRPAKCSSACGRVSW